jgi:hypothetical protein
MNASNYIPMCKAFLSNVRFAEDSPVGSPAGSPFDATMLARIVQPARTLLPAAYRTGYVDPLLTALPEVVTVLRQQLNQEMQGGMSRSDALADVTSIADTLVGAVRDWGEPEYRGPLGRFEAVVSNFYRSFLSAEQRAQAALPLVEFLPPLVTFAPTAAGGPFTLPSDAVKDLVSAPIGIVSLPGSYRAHPLLWPALAHETGGHDVLHADPGLLDELARGVAALPTIPKGIAALWNAWMDEAASDVYGLLNIGPAFAVSLAAFFSALGASNATHPSKIGTVRTQLPVVGRQLADVHPVDLLRLYLAMGVVDSLVHLSSARRTMWLTLLDAIAQVAADGAMTIDVVDVSARVVVQKLPLAPMADAAKQVGKFIAAQKLKALHAHSIQDIETWDDADEEAATAIAAAVNQGAIDALGDDAQLLAGTTMALLNTPTSYDTITSRLASALDDSLARDPFFGSVAPRTMFGARLRGSSHSRTAVPPQFPMEVS